MFISKKNNVLSNIQMIEQESGIREISNAISLINDNTQTNTAATDTIAGSSSILVTMAFTLKKRLKMNRTGFGSKKIVYKNGPPYSIKSVERCL
ncbi:MAG: hypothetical protein C0403_05435 [Desulfobacterium sp.]|nr:hypothetical protein [Desulfobacterium sp.]